ncbi:MAG: class II aldolase/adducin family protein [Chitinivibrionales bacterium]|nr:class II aldolase/adducin family protein [Chitinivibrionales bacterium]
MKNRWSDADAGAQAKSFGESWGADRMVRIYTARLLGAEKTLVLHGGGNVSVKTNLPDIFNKTTSVLCIKASGCDLATMTPADLCDLEQDYLQKLLSLPAISDDVMIAQLKAHRLDDGSRTPSVETLMHAAIPHAFVDHTHADAILTLTNQKEGKTLIAQALGKEVAVVDYVLAGFSLAKAVAAAIKENPRAAGWCSCSMD